MTTLDRGTNTRTLRMFFGAGSAAVVVQYAAGLVLARVVFRGAGAATFGVWATVSSLLAIGALADAGMKLELSRRVAEAAAVGDWPGVRRVVHLGVTMLSALAAVVVVGGTILTPLIRSFVFPAGAPGMSTSELDLLLRAVFLLIGITLVAEGYFAVLKGVQRGDVEMQARIAGLVVGTTAAVVAVTAGWGLWGLFLGACTTTAVQLLVEGFRTRSVVPEATFRFVALRDGAWRGMLGLSSMLLLSQLSDVVDSQWDKIVLSRYVGSAAVANFQVGVSLVLQTKALALLPLAPLLVAMAEHRAGPTRQRLFHELSSSTIFAGTVALGAVVVFAPAFVNLWLGADLPEAVTASRMFAVAVGLNLVVAPLAYKAIADGKHRLTAIASAANIAVNAVLSFVLTVLIGFEGPLWGSIAGNAVASGVFLVLMRRDLAGSVTRETWCIPLVGVVACASALALGVGEHANWLLLIAGGCALVGVISVGAWLSTGFVPWRVLRPLEVE